MAAFSTSELSGTLLALRMQLPVVVLEDYRTSLKGSSGELVLRKGARLELTLAEAIPLIRRGVVAVDSGRLYSLQELNKLRWIESKDLSEVQRLDEDFYVKARLSITTMASGGDASRAELAKANLVDIVKLRLQKVLRAVAANAEPSRDFAERLTVEERALYISLCKLVSSWHSSMVSFAERGDPLG